MTDSPRITVVIPVYEQPELLSEALDSVDNQTFSDFETIVVDDNSATDFRPVVDEYGDWVRLITHERNKGAAAARNTAIETARGEFLAFLDADDRWRATKLERQIELFESGSGDLGLVYTGFAHHDLDGNEWIRRPSARGEIYLEELEQDRIHPTSTVMIRRECVESVGMFDASLPSRQDYDLWIRITEQYRVDYVDEILVDKREQPDSISTDFERRVAGDCAVLEKVRQRSTSLDFRRRTRILSYHYHVLGRDHESNGDRRLAIKYLSLAVFRYPFRPISWAMLGIAVLGIDRNGRLITQIKRWIQ
jgi:glycosyltransferase involved in cell wall biosynthesis